MKKELTIKISEKEEVERFISILCFGIIEAVKKKTMTFEEAGYYFLRPYSAKILKRKGVNNKLVELINLMCELEDVERLIPNKLEEAIDDVEKQLADFMLSVPEATTLSEYWIEND